MSVKVTLSPKQAAALYLAATAGMATQDLTPEARQNAVKAINRLYRRIEIHRVEIQWANEASR